MRLKVNRDRHEEGIKQIDIQRTGGSAFQIDISMESGARYRIFDETSGKLDGILITDRDGVWIQGKMLKARKLLG